MRKKSPIWHPLTQHKIFPEMIPIARAEGAYLHTPDGKKILDCISSWWVNTHGHCHPKIVRAVQDQAARLEQVIFAGFTHEPAETLAEKLIETAAAQIGPGLSHVFYSDSGSTAVEVAIKMALGYFKHTGRPRHKIIALEGGYHGDTIGTMSTGARGVFNDVYAPLLFDVIHVPPAPEKLREVLEKEKDQIAAFVFEPLVQGASGMQMYKAEDLKALHDLCKSQGILTIADEVMTGFGRTGTMFACRQAGIVPDLLCLSKGLTGGFLPMSATLCTPEIYDAFYDDARARQFFHSSSFTGNALSCAAALAALEVWEEEPVEERLEMIAACHGKAAERFRNHPDVTDVRTLGTIFALDIKDDVDGYLSDIGVTLYRYFMDHGLLLRPIGNTVYILPPYCITKEELERVYERIEQSLSYLRHERGERAA